MDHQPSAEAAAEAGDPGQRVRVVQQASAVGEAGADAAVAVVVVGSETNSADANEVQLG